MITLDNFHDIRLLHAGRKNTIYAAKRASDQLPVVLKALVSNPSKEDIVRIYHEFAVGKELLLPGIIKTYELIDGQNQYILVKEDMGGMSLDDYIKQFPITDLEIFYTIAKQMVLILKEIHRKNVIHKDIKPANFIINPVTYVVKLTDFNFAAQLNHEVQEVIPPEDLEGTLAYMAPEQTGRMNMKIDYRSDFYALGVTFYELLTRQLPFSSTDPLELVHAHLAIAPPNASINPLVPRSLACVIEKLMAKDPALRYQSAIGILKDLERCQKGEKEIYPLGKEDVPDHLNLSQKLYGREFEIKKLLQAYDRVSTGSVEVLMVSGYSGIGKTMLVSEVHKPMVKDKGRFISGKFDQLERNTPYTALTQALNQLAGLLLSEPKERFEVVKQALLQALGNVAQIIIELAPNFEAVLGPQPPLPPLPAQESERRMITFFKRFLHVVASKDHPLVLFIDDLQWVDSGSLKLLEVISLDKELTHLLLIGSYRDNEVDINHPLKQLFQKLQAEKTIQFLPLGPLTLANFHSFFSDSFLRHDAPLELFADLIHKRTEGNPFFCKQALNTLYKERLLYFDYTSLKWDWNIEGIEALKISDNVVDLMLSKLTALPAETQSLLKYAACIGSRFVLETLQWLSGHSADTVSKGLMPALQEELIGTLKLGYKSADAIANQSLSQALSKEITYQFAHDRIQQAVYEGISREEKSQIHLSIARFIVQNQPVACKQERLFEVTDHFNQAHSLLHENEKLSVVEFNYLAGTKAQGANAYTTMLKYLENGLALTDEKGWENYYDLMFSLNRAYTQSLYLTGEREKGKALETEILKRAKTAVHKANIYSIQSLNYETEGNFDMSMKAGLEALKLLGIKMPLKPSKFAIKKKFQEVDRALKKHHLDTLEKEIPPLQDEKSILIFEIMEQLYFQSTVYLGSLYGYFVCESMLQILHYGLPKSGSLWIAGYALAILYETGNVDLTFKLWDIAERILKQVRNTQISPQVYFIYASYFSHLKHPHKAARAYYEQAIQDAIESGNIRGAVVNLWSLSNNIEIEAKSLQEVREGANRVLDYSLKANMKDFIGEAEIYLSQLDGLLGNIEVGEYQLKLFQNIEDPLHKVIAVGNIASYFYNVREYEEGKECYFIFIQDVKRLYYEAFSPSTLMFCVLSLAQCVPKANLLKKIYYQYHLRWMLSYIKGFAKINPHNYLHFYLILCSIRAKRRGSTNKAIHLLEQAIANAKKGDFYLWVAIASEMAAEIYLKHYLSQAAQGYIQQAYYYYERFGMEYKVKWLAKKYPEFLSHQQVRYEPETPLTESIRGTSSSTLDFSTILKANQSISSEIEVDKLLEKMLQIVTENAGAHKAVFVELQKSDWVVTATFDAGHAERLNTPLQGYQELPQALLNVARRARQAQVVSEPARDDRYAGDPYIQRVAPLSIMCLPIIHQDRLVAMLYLENRLTSGAFTQERLAVLSSLSSQIAISLINSRHIQQIEGLYRAMEKFVPKAFLKLLNKEHIEEVRLGDCIETNMTVLFTDIRGYTTLSEKMNPNEVYSFINSYLKCVAPIIRTYNGFISQYLGDGIMALFPTNADDGVSAVLEMQKALLQFNEEQTKEGRPTIQVGFGLNTGRAMVGTLGEEGRMDANVISDAINLASRIEGLNKYYGTECLISDTTLKGLRYPEIYKRRPIDKVMVKGKKTSVDLYEIFYAKDLKITDLEFIERYEAALQVYKEGDFNRACLGFKECLNIKPSDKPSAVLSQRCEQLLQTPPAHWDGTWHMTEK